MRNFAPDTCIILHVCDAVTNHTFTRTTTELRVFKLESSNLDGRVEEECSYHLVTVSVPQYSQFSDDRINLIALLTHLVYVYI
jgi:hypothetical protein